MTFNLEDPTNSVFSSSLLLALHSCSETLGVAVFDSRQGEIRRRSETFKVGRDLSKNLLTCVEELIPSSDWDQLNRLAVAIGPGGFTGTRLTVVLARTLAQQLGCKLDGISSFALMAPRLAVQLSSQQLKKPFWILKELNRRGIIGGLYQLQRKKNLSCLNEVIEIKEPHLLSEMQINFPALKAKDNVLADIRRLLDLCEAAHNSSLDGKWSGILPIYPTSPVSNN